MRHTGLEQSTFCEEASKSIGQLTLIIHIINMTKDAESSCEVREEGIGLQGAALTLQEGLLSLLLAY